MNQYKFVDVLKSFFDTYEYSMRSLEDETNVLVHRIVAKIVLEFLFLERNGFENLQLYSEYFDEVSVSTVYMEKTQETIEDIYDAFGEDVIINKYGDVDYNDYRNKLEKAVASEEGHVLSEFGVQAFGEHNCGTCMYFLEKTMDDIGRERLKEQGARIKLTPEMLSEIMQYADITYHIEPVQMYVIRKNL